MSELKGFRCDECETETEDLTQWTTIHYFKLMPDIFGGEYYTPQINHYCSSVCLAKNIDKYQAIQDTTDKEKK